MSATTHPVRCRGGARGVVCKEEKLAINSNETETSQRLVDFREQTYRGPDSQRHAVAALLDEVDDVAVVEGVDLHVVHGKDSVSHLEATATFSWRAWKEEIFLLLICCSEL